MKFMHIADVHLGARPDAGKPWSELRRRDIWDTFEKVIDKAEEERVDLLLIAGDLFHRQPLLKELREVDDMFTRLSKTRVVIMAGNHDYMKADSYYHTYKWNERVYFFKEKEPAGVYYPDLKTTVYGMSYHTREIQEDVYEHIELDKKARFHILLAHGGDERHCPLNKNRLKNSGFDYIALGHIHKPGVYIEGKAIYAGALEPIDINDTGPHGYVIGEIGRESVVTRFVPFAGKEYVHEKIIVNSEMTAAAVRRQIQEMIRERGREHIYRFVLEGFRRADLIFDPAHLETLGLIYDILDHTEPEYDLDQIETAYGDHLIGRFVSSLRGYEKDSVENKALHYGLQALMEALSEKAE